jgi:hypothetical protein
VEQAAGRPSDGKGPAVIGPGGKIISPGLET